MTNRGIDAACAIQLARDALPDLAPILTAQPVPKGHGHECWRLELPDGAVMLKVAHFHSDQRPMENLALALRTAAEHGIRCPRLLWFGATPRAFDSRAMLIQTWIEGMDGEEYLSTTEDVDGRTHYFVAVGHLVGRLHQIRPAFFSPSISDHDRARSSWQAVVEERVDALVKRTAAASVLAREQLELASRTLIQAARDLNAEVEPTLTHRDLYPANTVVQPDGSVALVDFEHGSFWDGVHDFVKLGFWVFEEYAGSEESFLAGYRQTGPRWARFDERLRLCTGLELLAGLTYWRTREEWALEEEWHRRFASWLGEAT